MISRMDMVGQHDTRMPAANCWLVHLLLCGPEVGIPKAWVLFGYRVERSRELVTSFCYIMSQRTPNGQRFAVLPTSQGSGPTRNTEMFRSQMIK